MDRFEALRTFVAVAEERGFAKAARRLGQSPPAVTRAIAALERHLGVSLFHRSTRSVVATEEGVALLDRARDLLLQLRDAEQAVMGGQSAPRGELHVTAPVVFGRLHVVPVLADLLARHRDMTARLMLVDRNIRLVEEGIDVAVRIGELPDSSLIALAIGAVRQTIVASPDYCRRRGTPMRPEELVGHDVIAGDNIRIGAQWRFGHPTHRTLPLVPRITVNSVDATLAAAAAGLGLANVLSYQAAEGLASGALCRVLDDHAPPPIPVHLVYPAGRARLPAVRLFVAAMRERSRALEGTPAGWGPGTGTRPGAGG